MIKSLHLMFKNTLKNRKIALLIGRGITGIIGIVSLQSTLISISVNVAYASTITVTASGTLTGTVSTPLTSLSVAATPAVSATSATPTALLIPAAHVNAQIIPVGITKTDNLGVPPNFVQVGWYKYGPVPGAIGNAVLDGHVDNGGSINGVFKQLHTLKAGDG